MNELNLLINAMYGWAAHCDQDVDDDILYKKIRSHDIEPFFLDYFKRHNSKIAEDIQNVMRLNVEFYRVLYSQTLPLFCRLEREQIPYALIKGLYFALRSYNDLRMRSSSDIDILVDRKDYTRLKLALLREGFVQGYKAKDGEIIEYPSEYKYYYLLNTHQSAPFIKRTVGVTSVSCISIDVNLKVLWGDRKQEGMHAEQLLRQLSSLSFHEHSYSVLSDENALLAYCLNIYKDNNTPYMLVKNKGYRIRQLADIYYFVKYNHIDWHLFQHKVCSYQMYDCIWQVLYLVSYVFQDFTICHLAGLPEHSPASIRKFGIEQNERTDWGLSIAERVKSESLSQHVHMLLSDFSKENIKVNEKYMML